MNNAFTRIHDERLAAEAGPEVQRFQQMLAGDLSDADLWWRYAIALSDYQWLNRDAADAVSIALAIDPLNADYSQFRGYCHLKLGLLQEAAADFELSLKLNPQKWNAAYYLGMTYFYMGEYGRACGVYDRMWDMTSPNGDGTAYNNWYYLTARKLGDAKRAAQALTPITAETQPVVSVGTLGNTWDDGTYLTACKVYRGFLTPEEALEAYAARGKDTFEYFSICLLMGLYADVEGDTDRTKALFQDIVDRGVAKSRSPSVAFIIEPRLKEL